MDLKAEWKRKGDRDRQFKECLPQRPVALAVAKKVGYQFPASPEGKLMRGVFVMAVGDLFACKQRRSAALFLTSEMPSLLLCGVDPEWARNQLLKAGVSLDPIY